MAIAMFDLSLIICEIFAKTIKWQKVWPWRWRSMSRSSRTGLTPFNWKCSVPYRWILFQNLCYMCTYVYAKDNTNTDTHTARHGWWLSVKSAKQICLKTQLFYIALLSHLRFLKRHIFINRQIDTLGNVIYGRPYWLSNLWTSPIKVKHIALFQREIVT